MEQVENFMTENFTRSQLKQKIKQIVAKEFWVNEDKVFLTSNLRDDFGADSLGIMEILILLEKEFDIVILEEENNRVQTVDDMYNLCRGKLELVGRINPE